MKYIIFLRGINVGGHKKVPMAELKKMLADTGFENVQTLLNSGNVVFETRQTNERDLIELIGKNFRKSFGFESQVMARAMDTIQSLIDLDPFKGVNVDKDTRLYVTFLPEKSKSDLQLPYNSPGNDFRILQKTEREVFSVLQVNTARSVDAMTFLEKEYGKTVTTRNWNTVVKLASK